MGTLYFAACFLSLVTDQGLADREPTRAIASTSQNVTMMKAPSRPPTPVTLFCQYGMGWDGMGWDGMG